MSTSPSIFTPRRRSQRGSLCPRSEECQCVQVQEKRVSKPLGKNDSQDVETATNKTRAMNTEKGYASIRRDRASYYKIKNQVKINPNKNERSESKKTSCESTVDTTPSDFASHPSQTRPKNNLSDYEKYENDVISMIVREKASSRKCEYLCDYNNTLQKKLAVSCNSDFHLNRDSKAHRERQSERLLKDPFFSTHYKQINRAALQESDRRNFNVDPTTCERFDKVKESDEPVRSSREIHLELAVEEAQKVIAELTSRLNYVQTELDIKTEEVK